ncbi:MAG: CapA family protein [Candidatus Nanopelagicales bacterium]|nr:CapA family protein [Candidatus Nanopelagicales bacterium]
MIDRLSRRPYRHPRTALAAVVGIGLAGLLSFAGCSSLNVSSAVDSEPLAGGSPAATDAGGQAGREAAGEQQGVQSAAAPGAESITVVANGDILIHNSLWFQAERDGGGRMDFAPQLAGVQDRVKGADFAICHMETPLAPAGGPYLSYPVFSTPPQIVDAIKSTGYDACTTASNHTLDQGFSGVKRTIDALEKAGIGHAGSARTAAEASKPAIHTVKGTKVAHLAYATDFNGYSVPASQPWCCNRLSAAKVISDARAARDAGAQIVVVAMHGGDENVAKPNAAQRQIAKDLADSGAVDLVIGGHVHVVQPVEKVGNMWVAYGHGNLISGQYESWRRNREGVTTEFTFTRQSDGSYRITKAAGYPVFNSANPSRLVDLVSALPKSGGDARLVEAYRQTKTTLLSLGAAKDGFVVPDPGGR